MLCCASVIVGAEAARFSWRRYGEIGCCRSGLAPVCAFEAACTFDAACAAGIIGADVNAYGATGGTVVCPRYDVTMLPGP